jgi:ATP-dependent Clp protease ATP-binding subunit ClpC
MLDLALVVAGSMFRGEFESRLKSILDQIRDQKNTILFIDELHTIIGAGATTGSLDAANILKPALARSELTVIGATTFTDFKRYIENDPALERRFQPVFVEEPSIELTQAMLIGLKPHYEKHHNIIIDDEAIKSAVVLSSRYINDRFLPDKAIDIIDEAAAGLTKTSISARPRQQLRQMSEELKKLEQEKAQCVISQDFQGALRIKLEQDNLKAKIEGTQKEIESHSTKAQGKLSAEHVIATIASIANIKLSKLAKSDSERLLELETSLARSIIGQDDVLRSIAETIRRTRTGVASPKRPIGSFLFLGPTGVGKTETAKVLAQELFDSPKNLVRIDMSEFMERHNVARLLGAAPGYVGFEDGGRLTEAVRRRPYSVVLFDEIEKAHPDVFNLLLQIMEEGELTDASGKKVNFRNTIIILTSNIGGTEFQKKKLGFAEIQENETADLSQDVLVAVRERLSPELLNRIDSIAIFKPLSRQSLKEVVKLELSKFAERLNAMGLSLKTDANLITFLHEKSLDPARGARMVRNTMQQHIESVLSSAMLSGNVKKPGIVRFKIEGKKDGEKKVTVVSV